jgi:EAL domain-containing protein (putative c-di-GMP-specific phosphodiesterase class I)/CHASE2 domain-containing sensor protein
MRSVRSREGHKPEGPPFKALLWTAIAALLFGLLGVGDPVDNWLRISRNSMHMHAASGDIVLVKLDDASFRQVSGWPWPRRNLAQLNDALTKAGARRIFYHIPLDTPTDAADDSLFAQSLQRSGRDVLPVVTRSGAHNGVSTTEILPLPMFARYAEVASVSVRYNYQDIVWNAPYATTVDGRRIPSLAAKLARRPGLADEVFPLDYSVDPGSIPDVSAASVLNGTFDPSAVRGKDVLIGITSDGIGNQYFIPGAAKMGAAYVHVIAAETLKAGKPMSLGWVPALFVAIALAALALRRRGTAQQSVIIGLAMALLTVGPVIGEIHEVFVDVAPALFFLLIIGAVVARHASRLRGYVNPISGLPNLNALRSNREARDQAIIVARVLNYAEVLSNLPPESEEKLVEQIVSRLRVGSPDRILYQGDGGMFAWLERPQVPFGNHLDALYSLFRNPARIESLSIDLSVSFGVEIGSGRSLSNRLASAVVAAEEAAHDGLKWKYHDPDTLEHASWKLSMLSQLDSAIDKGEVWIAYQPKLDLASKKIIGAEALARWTHPEKGPIAASEFIAAAEQHDRIGKLTDFVLEKAVAAASQLNRKGHSFNVAVNLSARLLTDRGFTLRLSALLARHQLKPENLTLELTETAALAGSGEVTDMLNRLRDLGVKMSIDDYGTGLSTMDYLKKIPAAEIKIDQSFVKGIVDNRSDRLMVQSTIALAHALDRKVVAEGVEQREILDSLSEMGCDVAQGYIIGRPMSIESLMKRLSADKRQNVA